MKVVVPQCLGSSSVGIGLVAMGLAFAKAAELVKAAGCMRSRRCSDLWFVIAIIQMALLLRNYVSGLLVESILVVKGCMSTESVDVQSALVE